MRHIATYPLIALGLLTLPVSVLAQKNSVPLDTLVQCKPGTTITVADVQTQFVSLGLKKGKGGFYFAHDNKKIAFMGGEILAASAFAADGETNVSLYLDKLTGKQLAKKLRVTTIDEFANTDEPSYFKETSTKTMLLVSSATELDTGTTSIAFQSAITCKVYL